MSFYSGMMTTSRKGVSVIGGIPPVAPLVNSKCAASFMGSNAPWLTSMFGTRASGTMTSKGMEGGDAIPTIHVIMGHRLRMYANHGKWRRTCDTAFLENPPGLLGHSSMHPPTSTKAKALLLNKGQLTLGKEKAKLSLK